MTLPSFLGIGAQRSGTTWLDAQLRRHPAVYLPSRRKEVHFFDEYYNRGIDWYRDFFPPGKLAAQYRAVGEITPKYLYVPEAAARIPQHLPQCRLIAVLRNPADRAYSQYGHAVKNFGETRPFEDFLRSRPDAFERGLYARQLSRYFDLFPRERMLVLFFEQSIARDPAGTLQTIANFLELDAFECSRNCGQAIGGSHVTRFPRARAAASSVAMFLRRRDLDVVVNVAKSAGLPKLFGRCGSLPRIDRETRASLLDRYESDIAQLERLLGVDLDCWRAGRPKANREPQPAAA